MSAACGRSAPYRREGGKVCLSEDRANAWLLTKALGGNTSEV
jgi:hypothetical protein